MPVRRTKIGAFGCRDLGQPVRSSGRIPRRDPDPLTLPAVQAPAFVARDVAQRLTATWHYASAKRRAVTSMLDRERAYFSQNDSAWAAAHPGRFVVVKDETLVGTFASLDEALAAGASRFGLQPFLVRQLGVKPEPVSIPALTLGLLRADP